MSDPVALLEATRAVFHAAQAHKRSANYHRKQAADLMARYGRLQRLCAENGIEVEFQSVEGEDQRRSRPHEQHSIPRS